MHRSHNLVMRIGLTGWTLTACLLIAPAVAWAGKEEAIEAYKRGDYAAALAEFLPLAEEGDPFAELTVGWMYDYALGVPHDDAQAVRWYRSAAEHGYPVAQHYLGLMYADGNGVPQDFPEAEKWFRRAAEQGNPGGQYGLGVMYRDGVEVAQDRAEAYKWFTLARRRAVEDEPDEIVARDAADALAELTPHMSAEELAEGDRRASAWHPTPEQATAVTRSSPGLERR